MNRRIFVPKVCSAAMMRQSLDSRSIYYGMIATGNHTIQNCFGTLGMTGAEMTVTPSFQLLIPNATHTSFPVCIVLWTGGDFFALTDFLQCHAADPCESSASFCGDILSGLYFRPDRGRRCRTLAAGNECGRPCHCGRCGRYPHRCHVSDCRGAGQKAQAECYLGAVGLLCVQHCLQRCCGFPALWLRSPDCRPLDRESGDRGCTASFCSVSSGDLPCKCDDRIFYRRKPNRNTGRRGGG